MVAGRTSRTPSRSPATSSCAAPPAATQTPRRAARADPSFNRSLPMPRYCLDLDSPAGGFIDSFLIGNGWLGATLNGGIGTERFDLNLDTVWSGGPLTHEEG